MFEFISIMPASFWVANFMAFAAGIIGWQQRRSGIGLPILAVLATVYVWYMGDAFYNHYAENHVQLFKANVLSAAWWQVAWFIVSFLISATWLHRSLNHRLLHHGSGVMQLFSRGVNFSPFQSQLTILFGICLAVWLLLALIAVVRLRGEAIYYFFPFLGRSAEPWGRARMGSGFDALLTVAFYLQQLAVAVFGIVAALSTRSETRRLALLVCTIAFPYFIFSRTRNSILAAVVPGILAWGLLRVRGALPKIAALGLAFVLVNAWMAFVIANRSVMSITTAFTQKKFSLLNEGGARHEGLNMFEELCWMNTFLQQGSYQPNWGARYFAEVVNIVPRSLWPGKPMIGIDYAVIRGGGGGSDSQAGIVTSFSTGLIGQGVANFGFWLGPAAAAIIMGFWAVLLARIDLEVNRLGYLALYGMGAILTFNLGRDVTLITIYPFLFGLVGLHFYSRLKSGHGVQPPLAASQTSARLTQWRPLRRQQTISSNTLRLGRRRPIPRHPKLGS